MPFNVGVHLPLPHQAHVVHNCRRLSVEFMNYVAASRSLRKVGGCVGGLVCVCVCVCVCVWGGWVGVCVYTGVGWGVNVWHVVFAAGELLLVKLNSLSTPSPHTYAQTFLSIKGIYYQAEIEGQSVTWIVPHHFKQTVKSSDIMIWLLNAPNVRGHTHVHTLTCAHTHTHTTDSLQRGPSCHAHFHRVLCLASWLHQLQALQLNEPQVSTPGKGCVLVVMLP